MPTATDAKGQATSARFEIDPVEADVVRQIFRQYVRGRSMKAIAFELNAEGVPFPAKDTKRGPARRGWAISSIHTILHNSKYVGRWVWNQTRFLKDPDTGRRRPVPRPPEEWVVQDHPELRVVEDELWQTVQARLALLGERFGDGVPGHPGAAAHVAYSPHLLAGLLRCGVCGARMHAAAYTRRKDERAYTYQWYVCGFAKEKGPAVCTHRVWYRRADLEGVLLARFREATTPPMLDALARAVRALVDAALQGRDERVAGVKAELLRLEREAAHLVGFLKTGHSSPTIWAELESTETAIEALRAELAAFEPQDRAPVPPGSTRSGCAPRLRSSMLSCTRTPSGPGWRS